MSPFPRMIFLALLAATGLFAGCATHDAFPRDWPPAAKTAMQCEDFSGTYADRAQASAKNVQALSLSRWLGVQQHADEIVMTIEIAAETTGRLTVIVHRTDLYGEPLPPLEVTTEVTCTDRQLRWPDVAKTRRDSLFMGYEHRGYQFRKGTDGSLIVRSSDDAAGTVLVVLPRLPTR
jgi:hypothetical protein